MRLHCAILIVIFTEIEATSIAEYFYMYNILSGLFKLK